MYQTPLGKFADPSAIITHFHLHEGDSVADFGAGSGHYLADLSHAVGQNGKVYACEIQKNLVETLGILIREQHLNNVHTLWCDTEAPQGTKLTDEVLHAVLISNMLFQCTDKVAPLTEAFRTLRRGGKLFLIDWTDSFGGLGPHPTHVFTEAMGRSTAESVGFVFERAFPAGDHHYGLAFRKQ